MRERNAVEGGFGVGKRRFSLAGITARLKETAESVIALQFLVMSLEYRLRLFLLLFSLCHLGSTFGAILPLL